jgi:hypothetical protein
VKGQPLFDYLVSRLIDSFDIPAFPLRLFGIMAPTCPDTHQGVLEPVGVMDGRSALMIRQARPQIQRWIDAGVPTPICLLKVKDSLDPSDLQHNHQVLVWGYYFDGKALSLAIYDRPATTAARSLSTPPAPTWSSASGRTRRTSARSTPSSRWHIRRSRQPRSPEPTLEHVCSRYRSSPLSRD